MSPTDEVLLARVLLDRDRYAFSELVRRHQSAVRSFLRRLTSDRAGQADDLAQETFLEAWRTLRRFRGESPFSSWLLGIAYNRFRSARRREKPQEELTEATLAQAQENGDNAMASASADRQTHDLRQDLAGAMEGLEPTERTAIHLCFASGLSHPEAASVMALPLGTLKTLVARAKTKLRDQLQAWAPDQ